MEVQLVVIGHSQNNSSGGTSYPYLDSMQTVSSTDQVLAGHEAQAGKALTGQQGAGRTLTSSRIDNDYGVAGKIGILPWDVSKAKIVT